MSRASMPTDEELKAAYSDLKSVWAVGARFKISGQKAHKRLAEIGAIVPVNTFTQGEKDRLVREYESYVSVGRLDDLAASMGRTKPFLCRQAKYLGLTKADRPCPDAARLKIGEANRKKIAENGHPRGMAGKMHTADTKSRLSAASSEMWRGLTPEQRDALLASSREGWRKAGSKVRARPEASWKAGWREIGGQRAYFRSRWEANYGRYLEWLRERGEIQRWEHEPETFWFEGIKRGALSYLPDFRVTERNGDIVFHEVKGWMDARSKTKISRMARQYPSVRLIVIDGKAYKKLASQVGPIIKGWE